MRSRDDLAIKDRAAQEVATRVAQGCTGAAKRFISTIALLRQAELNSPEAVEIGLEYALGTDAEANTFSFVFKRAFVSDYLDLDLRSALQMARTLSSELKTDQDSVRKDFEQLLETCARSKKLDLPRPQCGTFAMRITKKGENWNGGVAKSFHAALDFLTSEKGPSLTTGDALKLAEDLIASGPGSVENFTQAYRYAVAEKGMNLDREQAIAFSRKLSEIKKPATSSEQKR